MHDLLEQVQDAGGTSVCAVAGGLVARIEREAADGQLHESQAHAPDVRLDRVLRALDPFRRHVRRRADEGVGDRVHKLARDAKVAQLDVAPSVHEHVGRLDVSVHDPVDVVEIGEAAEDGFGNLSEHVDAHRTKVLRDPVQRATGEIKSPSEKNASGTARGRPYPQSMYSMHMITSPALLRKAP